MAGKIKGITIEIGGDTAPLQKALQGVNKEASVSTKELRQIDKALKFDTNNVTLLTQKQEVLAKQVATTKEKLEILRQAQSQVEAQFQKGEIGADQYRAFQREVETTKTVLTGYENKLEAVNKTLSSHGQGVETNKSKLQALEKEQTQLASESEKLNSSFKLQESQLGSTASESDKLALAQKKIASQSNLVEKQIANLEKQLELTKSEYGENSLEANKLEKTLNETKVAYNNLQNEMEEFINYLIESRTDQSKNVFLKLNETDYYKENKSGTLCHFPQCKEKAIGSHTYPKSVLKKISKGNEVYSTDIQHIVGNSYDKGVPDLVRKTNIKNSGVQPLFCYKHDTSVFKAVELQNYTTNIETYLCLFLYRSFIYDFQLESEVHNPSVNRKIYTKKDYSNMISKKDELKYLFNQGLATKLIEQNSSFQNYVVLKHKFDSIFSETDTPNYTDFCKHFVLKYFDLGFLPEFFASGSMFFSMDPQRLENPLQSIYAIIPDKSLQTAYFCILMPNESVDSMKVVIENLENLYNKYDKREFYKHIEFLLLDASQNIIMTETLYNILQINGDYLMLVKACISLVLTRLPICPYPNELLKRYSYKLLESIDLIANDNQ